MNRWVIVKLPSKDADLTPAFERELPVIFKNKARAEIMCEELNRNKPSEIAAYVVEERNSETEDPQFL
jgi:hypothetical protein